MPHVHRLPDAAEGLACSDRHVEPSDALEVDDEVADRHRQGAAISHHIGQGRVGRHMLEGRRHRGHLAV